MSKRRWSRWLIGSGVALGLLALSWRATAPAPIMSAPSVTYLSPDLTKTEDVPQIASVLPEEAIAESQETLRTWARTSPAEARAWALLSQENRAWLPFIAAQQAQSDLPALCEWLFVNLPASEAQSLLTLALTEVARDQPAAAVAYLVRLEESPERRELVGRIAAQWAEQKPAESIAWALAQTDPSERAVALVGALSPSSLTQPELSLKIAQSHLQGSYEYDRFAFNVLQHWIHDEPGRAMGWAISTLDRPLATQALEQFLPLWLEENPDDALSWVTSLRDPEFRARALSSIGAGSSG